MQQDDTRPTMPRREASWNEHIAAMRARKQAEAQGAPPAAREALAHAAAMDGPHAGRLPAAPIMLGTLWAIEETSGLILELCGDSLNADRALLCLTLRDPERVLLSGLAGDLTDLRAGMLEMGNQLTAEKALELDQWFGGEMARLKALTGGGQAAGEEPGKPASRTSASSAPEDAAGHSA